MKLKQALVLGLTTAVLAIPAFAADEAINATSQPSSVTTVEKSAVTPAKKEAVQKKGQKDALAANTAKDADLSKLSTVNPAEAK